MEPELIIDEDLGYELPALPSESIPIRDTNGHQRLGFHTFFDYLDNAIDEARRKGRPVPLDPSDLLDIQSDLEKWHRWLVREWDVPDLTCFWMVATNKRFDTEKGRKSAAAAAASFYLAFLKNAQEHATK